MYYRARGWSTVEIDWLKSNRDKISIDQMTIALDHSRTAIQRKMQELDGKVFPAKKNKKSYIGKRPDLGVFCRSRWEANCLRYFSHIGEEWLYEPKNFIFEKERRGAISYLPDVYLHSFDSYIEIKGQLTPRGRSAIRKFKKYYPDEFSRMKAITGGPKTTATKFFKKIGVPILFYYQDINKKFKDVIPNWE